MRSRFFILFGYKKIIIAHPSHLLGKRAGEDIHMNVKVFEQITNLFGLLMIGPLQKFKNVEAKKVAKAIISKINGCCALTTPTMHTKYEMD